jgi:flagellar hook protein FlgE
MFRSLYSGISGLSANLTALDVIGNNIANSNTIGFKSGRVTFSEMLTQTIKSASRPVAGGLGGTNPQQVGLGTQVGSIDTNLNQGNFQTTGMKTDLAIQGAGFFVLSDGFSSTYTRAGVFGLDSDNYFVDPTTGLKVQGVMADAAGNIGTGPLTDIFIDPGLVVPAEASTEVQLIGNLDADSDATETVRETPSFLVAADGTDLLVAMSGQRSGSLNLNVGDVIHVNGRRGGADLTTETFTVEGTTTYQDLVDWLNGLGLGLTFSVQATGALQVQNGGADVSGLSLSCVGKDVFNSNFLFEPTIAGGATSDTSLRSGDAGELRGYATEADLLANLYTDDGAPLDLDLSSGSTVLTIDGAVGGDAVPTGLLTVTSATTVADLMREIQYTLGINSSPVAIDEEGRIVVRGEVGTASALGEIAITEQDHDNSVLEAAFNFRQIQQARDQQTFSVATTLYDSLGGEHTVTFSFEKVAGLNEWIWTASCDGAEEIVSGGSGRIRFSETGAVTNFSFDEDVGGLTIDPSPNGEGAEPITVAIDFGDIGALNGLTQFEGSGSLQSIADGFTAGYLVDFNIDQSGLITGQFSNDTIRDIARIGLARFSNPAGLIREANNTYRVSGNSGDANVVFAGEGNGITLVPGALETSNVDLAQEFTRLVVAQRAFQANSRVITTGDEVMQELVNLVR